jgi:outer membrane protein assembly factor BamB
VNSFSDQEMPLMTTKRRILGMAAGAGALAFIGWLLTAEPVSGQMVKRRVGGVMVGGMPAETSTTPGGTNPAALSAIKLVEKSEYRAFIKVAQDCMEGAKDYQKKKLLDLASKEWNDGVTALQTILDQKEDFYVQVKQRDVHGRESVRWTSVKFEANSLLGSMPGEGLDVYEVRFGGKARQMLDDAKRKGDWEQVADVAQRFLHTKAGTEANELLATYFLDRGQFFTSALRFEQLLKMSPERVKVGELTLYKMALSCRRAGELKKADEAWKKLEPRLREEGGLRINGELVTIDQLLKVLNDIPRPQTADLHDWPLIHGNMTNSAQAIGSPPLLDKVLWQRPTVLDKNDYSGDVEKGVEAKEWIDKALKQNGDQAVLPGSFPIAAGKLLIYRSYTDVRAVTLEAEKDAQGKEIAKAGEIVWKTTDFDGSLAQVLSDSNRKSVLLNSGNGWLAMYERQPNFLNLVYENTLLGTLATDHRLVYAVDDLAVPAPGNVFQNFMWNMNNQQMLPNEIKPLVMGNSLQAFELQTGKIKWKLGGNEEANDPFSSSHFLGVPLSVGGRLYVLNEKNSGPNGDGELRLVTIDPIKEDANQKHKPRVISVQSLGMVQQQHRVTHDMSRRVNAVHLAYGEGILVCPTNAGEVLGVDLLTRSLAWAYPYREEARVQQSPNVPGGGFRPVPMNIPSVMASNWKSAPPVIQEGRVVFTAPDASSVHCVNLRDGKELWKSTRLENDLFLAGVFKGKVLIVGKNACRVLRLVDGAQLQYVTLDNPPAGQGVAAKDVYYLPLQKGEIVALNLNRETVTHSRATRPTALGNLVFHEGTVIAQGPLEIAGYPQLESELQLATAAVQADPNNPEKLFNRGELRLYDGQVPDAVADLRRVLELKPPATLVQKTKERLYEALTDLFQADFNAAAAKYLTEYRELCQVADSERTRQERLAKFLRIVGKGREDQGNLVEAFQMYRQFGDLPINKDQGVPALDNPATRVPTSAWLRGRVAAMMSRATPQQREPLEDKIAEEWKTVEAKNDIDAIRTFVGMFDVPFKVGRAARLRLADAIMNAKDKNAFLEAELNLEQLRVSPYRQDPALGGRALATLALLEEKKGTSDAMKLAAAYYRELARDFPKMAVRDGKTGTELLNDLAADKRFLPYLEDAHSWWGRAKIKARELPAGPFSAGANGFMFYPEGDLTPMMRNLRIVLEPTNQANPQVRLVDLANNSVRWTSHLGQDLTNTNFHYFQYLMQQAQRNTMYYPNARFRFFQVKGHLAVFQVGTMVYALDLDNSRVLWSHPLLKDGVPNTLRVNYLIPDQEGNLELVAMNNFTNQLTKIAVGHVGTAQASYVALVSQNGLEVLDPLKGTPIWSKRDVSAHSHVFGDEHHLFLVSGGKGITGAGRVVRASNGEPVEAPDFGFVYQNRIRVEGRYILAAMNIKDSLTVRRYDILTGKDLWTRSFDPRAVRLHTEDPLITGVIEPDGKMTVLDALTGKDVLQTSVVQYRIKKDDLVNLHEPLLLRDRVHYYLALNHPLDGAKIVGGLHNNFSNGLRCAQVNGWFAAFYREDGQRKTAKGDLVAYKQGDMHWHLLAPVTNQLVVLDQFENLPMILFTARYNRFFQPNGAPQWVTFTQSADRNTGTMIWDPKEGPQNSVNINPHYHSFIIDPKGGTVTMAGYSGALQHYVDDGRKTAQVIPQGVGNPYLRGQTPAYTPAPANVAPVIIRDRAVPAVRIQVAPPVPPAKR